MDATLSPRATLDGPHAPVTPMLRTVLVCDLVDSTSLVERLGDVRAMALMQRHDQRLRQALALCHGQLIDKADGVLALFERPIQALDFALRYQRVLRDLGASEGETLRARVGIHVGDVMIWTNAPADVLAGAKPFEVEGLAKPVAARLMGLALPGQILLSGMAQNLAQRAAGELGESGARLRWILHGRYRFKGVPAPMLVHEAGEPGLSPLRPPESGAKAWRELPLWRRPPVLALELLAVGLLGFAGLWSTLRAPPAIAFAERDWVVVADLQNRTGEPLFDDALDTALRVGLEQSRHVNLVSDLQVERALQRMQRQGQPVDRQLATEVALREGARAVILPTVAEVGGVIRVSLEVIDPDSGVTVYSRSEDGIGAKSVLASLDATIGEVRRLLGETLAGINSASLPLEKATTDDLEALRAFSLGVRARLEGRPKDAEALFREAVKLDPEFAMAWLRLAFLRYVEQDAVGTREYLDNAKASAGHLTRREALFLEGAEATLEDPVRAVEAFRLMASMYPDDYRAAYNEAYFAHFDLGEHVRARRAITAAEAAQNPDRAGAAHLAASIDLALNDPAGALTQIEKAETWGLRGYKRALVDVYLALRRYDDAFQAASQRKDTGLASQDLEGRLSDVTAPADRGDLAAAIEAARGLRTLAQDQDASVVVQNRQRLMALSMGSFDPGDGFPSELREFASELSRQLEPADSLARRPLLFQAMAAAWAAAHAGESDVARELLARYGSDPMLQDYPAIGAMARAATAEVALLDGRPDQAIAALMEDMEEGRGIYLTRAVALRAHASLGQTSEAAELADWLLAHRASAFGEPTWVQGWQPVNAVEANLALLAASRLAPTSEARESAAKALAEAWPDGKGRRVLERRQAALD